MVAGLTLPACRCLCSAYVGGSQPLGITLSISAGRSAFAGFRRLAPRTCVLDEAVGLCNRAPKIRGEPLPQIHNADRFEQPILNAPDECRARHWELDNQVSAQLNEVIASGVREAAGASF